MTDAQLNTVRSRWTAKDEAALQELQERKKRIDEQNREPLQQLAETIPGGVFGQGGPEDITKWLIENATELRTLLAPFDHVGD